MRTVTLHGCRNLRIRFKTKKKVKNIHINCLKNTRTVCVNVVFRSTIEMIGISRLGSF